MAEIEIIIKQYFGQKGRGIDQAKQISAYLDQQKGDGHTPNMEEVRKVAYLLEQEEYSALVALIAPHEHISEEQWHGVFTSANRLFELFDQQKEYPSHVRQLLKQEYYAYVYSRKKDYLTLLKSLAEKADDDLIKLFRDDLFTRRSELQYTLDWLFNTEFRLPPAKKGWLLKSKKSIPEYRQELIFAFTSKSI